MNNYHLNLTKTKLKGPTQEQIVTYNQWAALALGLYHYNSKIKIEFRIDGITTYAMLEWDSNFPKAAMKEKIDMANHGGVAIAWFVMSVLKGYNYVEQTEIGDGVDYRFRNDEPNDDDLNFLDDYHYVEISGILEESRSNTLKSRIKHKHKQIIKGDKSDKTSSVIVTLFSTPVTVKEIHK